MTHTEYKRYMTTRKRRGQTGSTAIHRQRLTTLKGAPAWGINPAFIGTAASD